jgi:hypothetical protein
MFLRLFPAFAAVWRREITVVAKYSAGYVLRFVVRSFRDQERRYVFGGRSSRFTQDGLFQQDLVLCVSMRLRWCRCERSCFSPIATREPASARLGLRG